MTPRRALHGPLLGDDGVLGGGQASPTVVPSLKDQAKSCQALLRQVEVAAEDPLGYETASAANERKA